MLIVWKIVNLPDFQATHKIQWTTVFSTRTTCHPTLIGVKVYYIISFFMNNN